MRMPFKGVKNATPRGGLQRQTFALQITLSADDSPNACRGRCRGVCDIGDCYRHLDLASYARSYDRPNTRDFSGLDHPHAHHAHHDNSQTYRICGQGPNSSYPIRDLGLFLCLD
jgi:hypothetical protein